MTLNAPQTITIRPAYADDELALRRLAAIDSAVAPPRGALLVAEVDGELHAALAIVSREVIADPFRPTAHLLQLLAVHADEQIARHTQRAAGDSPAGPRPDLRGRLSRLIPGRAGRSTPVAAAARAQPLRSRV